MTQTVIGIAGGSGSGKTTLARGIHEHFTRSDGTNPVSLICLDSYYLPRDELSPEERAAQNYDCPEAFDFALLRKQLAELRDGKTIECPVYDYSLHTRSCKTVAVAPSAVIIVEGILLFCDEPLRDMFDVKVFVDTDADVRILRRIKRDVEERGRSIESVEKQYLGTVKPMHELYVEPSRKYADIIIREGGHNRAAMSILINYISRYIEPEENKLQ